MLVDIIKSQVEDRVSIHLSHPIPMRKQDWDGLRTPKAIHIGREEERGKKERKKKERKEEEK